MLLAAMIVPGAKKTDLPDEKLLLRIAKDDQDAFLALYSQARGPVFAFALSLLRNRQEAEDITQDTFLKVRSAAHLYRPQGKPMAWILTITKNLCLMQMRRNRMFTGAPLDEERAPDGLDQISDAEDRLTVQAAFRVLTGEELRIIMLHAVSGMKHRQIASVLGLPLSTVLSRYNRGLKKLKKELQM